MTAGPAPASTPYGAQGPSLPRAGAAAALANFEAIYDEHAEFVWRSIRRLGVDTAAADDVLQQVFLVVYRRLGEFAGSSSMRTWLFGILLRVVREHRRSLFRKSPHLRNADHAEEDLATVPDRSAGANPEQALSRAEASRVINRLLDTLDDDKRAIFVMADLEQLTAVEIGEALGLEPKAVYSRLRAARTDFERAAAALRRQDLGRKP